MDLIINYPTFRQDIKDNFKDLIQEFDLKIIELHEGCYLLKGIKCNIRFTYDRGDISCHFKQVSDYQDSPGYNVWAVFKHLYPSKEVSDNTKESYDAKLQLLEYSNIVKDLKSVLNGNFWWLGDFLQKEKRANKLLNYVLSLDSENFISKKFWSGDISWQQDIEKYVNQNNINL